MTFSNGIKHQTEEKSSPNSEHSNQAGRNTIFTRKPAKNRPKTHSQSFTDRVVYDRLINWVCVVLEGFLVKVILRPLQLWCQLSLCHRPLPGIVYYLIHGGDSLADIFISQKHGCWAHKCVEKKRFRSRYYSVLFQSIRSNHHFKSFTTKICFST